MKQKTSTTTLLLTLNLAATLAVVIYLIASNVSIGTESQLAFVQSENGQYVLYIGTNDKDTYEQIIETEEAIDIVNGICAKHVEGYTLSKAQGGWVDEKGVLTQENTLVYTLSDADESSIIAIMDEILEALNQNTILVEKQSAESAFYTGREK